MARATRRLPPSRTADVRVKTRSSVRRPRQEIEGGDVPHVYRDLLSEATPSMAAGPDEDEKPLKKRRTAAPSARATAEATFEHPGEPTSSRSDVEHIAAPTAVNTSTLARQTIEDSDESDESDESDMEWEDVLGDGDTSDQQDQEPEIGGVSITIEGEKPGERPKGKSKRPGINSAERRRRIDIHKMHIVCLLYHAHQRNTWCNDGKAQQVLRKLPSAKILTKLIPSPELPQWEGSKKFLDGLKDLNALWAKSFSVTALGMHKPRWLDSESGVQVFSAFDELDEPMDIQDFRKAASKRQGSQDIGAQLFCTLLRAIGLEARLVCSLQCLPLVAGGQSSSQKNTPAKDTIYVDPYNKSDTSLSPLRTPTPHRGRSRPLSRLERAMGAKAPTLSTGVAPTESKRYHTSHPVFWVEVYNVSQQKWVAMDPLSTGTVDRPDKLEPPLNNTQNTLTYAVAFEEDYTAKDVTRRYAKAYNAKTRRLRIEATDGGDKWWRKALKPFRRAVPLDRDQVEDAALARAEAREGMPKNVQDFKGHPIYVLERHLRHNEVIHPMHPVGKVNVGSAMNPRMESIYRRSDVHVVRSADKWYRLGRDVKTGEQPLKHAKPKKNRRVATPSEVEMDEYGEEIGVGLYAVFQTEIYIPPPVVNGRVPRNAFGNLDVYVPSMVPPGGVHIRHKQAAKAARMIGVDYADAVTGFSFKGRHGTAIVQGAIVAEEHGEAVQAVIDAMDYAQEKAEEDQRIAEVLRMWRRFLVGLRIKQRVNAIEIDGEVGPVIDVQEAIEREGKEMAEKQLAGGFFVDDAEIAEPTSRQERSQQTSHQQEPYEGGGGFVPNGGPDDGGGFIPFDNDEDSGGYVRERKANAGGFIPEEDGHAGGVVREDDTDGGGGFLPDANNNANIENAKDVSDQREASLPTDRSLQEHKERGLKRKISADDLVESEDSTDAVEDDGKHSLPGTPTAKAKPTPTSSPSEAGSLPLEDPEDEDADPEWLVDAT
ncbi:Rad4-domain-containing protein [Sporormia fimetaria CBS 119925]|uniref:Rad4-domain-containing protein n=1 Tax=Sporormia fimetaria CBS 119925 TaxID=1340428 RepID=A0A6A6VKV0_9PLEO|nr:Rad4-domain-containing protein [Sporormia fimetaria CBS 119925]